MPKSLELKILERQLKLATLELARLEGTIRVPNELEESEGLKHTPVNSGPDYLTVHCSTWHLEKPTEHGTVKTLEEARSLAKRKGYKGISIVFGGEV